MQTISMDEFSLKWRWDNESHCLLSNDELCQISPLSPTSSQQVWEKSLGFVDSKKDYELRTDLFDSIETIDATSDNDVERWLRTRMGKNEIFVSWDRGTAVITSSDVFIQHWNDFCYPSSDDVTIWPKDISWVIQYRHHEQYSYGQSIKPIIG